MKLYFFNDYHYGNCLSDLHILIGIAKYNKVSCEFCCDQRFHAQLNEFVPKNSNVMITNAKTDQSLNLYEGADFFLTARKKLEPSQVMCDRYQQFEEYFKLQLAKARFVCDAFQLTCPFKVYEDMLFDEETLAEVSPIDQSFDYLIVNSYGFSGQVNYTPFIHDLVFNDIINRLKKCNNSFITTKKHLDSPSTTDYRLSLTQIGQLAKNCKNIIGITTSPYLIALNKYSFKNFEKIIVITHTSPTFDLDSRFIIINHLYSPILPAEWKKHHVFE